MFAGDFGLPPWQLRGRPRLTVTRDGLERVEAGEDQAVGAFQHALVIDLAPYEVIDVDDAHGGGGQLLDQAILVEGHGLFRQFRRRGGADDGGAGR